MALPKIKFAGGGERFQYLTHSANDTTIRFVLNYPGVIDPDVMRKAVKVLVESVDILHSTFFTDPNMAYWKMNQNVEEHNYFHYIRTEGDPAVTAHSLSLLPVYPEDKVQLRCELVQSSNASSVVLLISHLCVDGGDGKYLLNKLVEAYNLILNTGTADSLEVKNGSRAPEKIYETMELKDIKDILKLPFGGKMSSTYPFPTEEDGMCRVTKTVISRETMSAARKKAKEVGASANDLLLAACYQVYAAFPEVEPGSPVGISSMMDLRRHCKDGDSEGLANMSGGMGTGFENGVPERFGDTLAEITRQTTAIKEDPLAGMSGLPILHSVARGIPVWVQLAVVGKAYSAIMPVGLTNLGNLNCGSLALGELIPTGGIFGGPLKKKPGMQISVISFDGECVLACYGRYTAEDEAHIQNTLDAMAEEIVKYAQQ